ncbi:MAG TPA: hypothetical protein VH165_07535 [Kofleriaceae bacterium]|jgi:hypothetical protein|nr:hypothetical protein [Kofleriaceae bacterium]
MIRWEAVLTILPLAACAAPDAPDPAPDPAPDIAPGAAPDTRIGAGAVQPPDPWTAPLGPAIAGATLADGWTDLRALPAPLAIQGGWTDSLFALPDGLHLRFAYEPTDFFQFFHSNGATQVITGPQLLGMTGTTFKLFDATLTSSGWSIATDPAGSPDPTIVEASPATNASDDLLVFTRFDAGTGRARLYYSSFAGGVWSAAAALPINSASCNDDNAKIVGELATSVTIYFESNRADLAGTGPTCGQRTLYTTTYANGAFTPVARVAGIATADSDDNQPFTADQQTLYWTSVRSNSYGIFTASRGTNGAFGAIHQIVTPTFVPPVVGKLVLVGEASVVNRPQGQLLYLMCGVAYNEHGGDTFDDADDIHLMPCVARRPNPLH